MDEPSPPPEQKHTPADGGDEPARAEQSNSAPAQHGDKPQELDLTIKADAPLLDETPPPDSHVSQESAELAPEPSSEPPSSPPPSPPRKRKRSILRRLLVLTLEIFAALAGLLVMGIVLAAWYVSRGPVDAGFLLPHIERAMNDVRGDLRLDIDQLYLEWHGLARPMGLEAKNVTLLNAGGPFMNIEAVDLDVSLKDSVLKGLRFREANIRGLSMRLQKDADGAVRMFNEGGTGSDTQNRTSPLTLSRIVSNLPPIYVLHLEDARIAYQDIARDTIRIFTDVDMELRQVSLDRDDTDVTGYVSLAMSQDQTRDILSVDFIYDGKRRELSLSGRLEKADLGRLLSQFGLGDARWNIALPLAARIGAQIGEEWAVRNFDVNAEIDGGTIVMPEIFGERPLNIGTGAIAAALNPAQAFLALNEASVMVEGMQISLGGGMALPTFEKKSFSGDFALMIDRIETDALDSIWPVFGRDEPAYEWLVEKASGGHFSDIAVRLQLGGVAAGTVLPANDAPQTAQSLDEPQALPDNVEAVDAKQSYSPLIAPPPSKPAFNGNAVVEGSSPPAAEAKSPQQPDFTTAGYDWRISGLNAGFNFAGLKIDYNPPMIPAEAIKGLGRVDGKSMTLDIDSAALGGLRATSGTVSFDDLVTAGAGHAKIALKINGPVRAAFEYLSTDPINFDEGLKIDIDRAKGQADVDVTVDFPAIKNLLVKDINVVVKGSLSNVTLPKVLHDLPLTGGPYQIDATQNEYRMTGQGFLDGHDIDLDWHSYFSQGQGRPYESRIKADLVANDDLRRKIGIDLSDHIEGALPVSVDYTDAWDKSSSIDVSGSLRTAILKIEPFEFVKPAGRDGRFSAKAILQDGKIDHLYDLDIMAETVTLKGGDFKFDLSDAHKGRIIDGKIARLAFGNNNFSVRLEEGRDRSMKISLEGEKLDARPFMARDDDGDNQQDDQQGVPQLRDKTAYEVGLKVQTMQTGDNAEIKGVQAFIRGGNGRLEQIELDAAVGKGALYMRYNPDTKERYSLRLEADDAGAALKAFGVTDKVTGGKMTVAGIPMNTGRGGDVRGLARIDDFQVSAAPALASLVKLLDVPTLLSSINTKGLSFARLETEFEWRNRRGGGLIRFIDGRTSGGSMGLTFEGDVNKTENTIDLSGTVVPASTLNSFFSGIPIVGDILSGGSGSIFAATYRMTGDSDDPKTTVNPLSVLAPGILRRLLFEN